MPLVMRVAGGRCCPQLVCDHCGEAVAESAGANVLVRRSDVLRPEGWLDVDGAQARVPLVVVHKACDRAYCRAAGRERHDYLWFDLAVFLTRLLHNTGTEVAKERRRIRDSGGLV